MARAFVADTGEGESALIERMRALLGEGLEIADAIARVNAYTRRLEGVRAYPDCTYEHLLERR